MAQRSLKKRSKPVKKGKRKAPARKPLGPKRGKGRVTAKKTKKSKARKQTKILRKNIGEAIEQEIRQRAVDDGNELRILKDDSFVLRKPPTSAGICKDKLRKC